MSTIAHSYNAMNWTANDCEFLSQLINFGLNEKEAQVYLQLLKCGPRPLSLLAQSLKTYRGDIHRMLKSLIDKGLVNLSLESPIVYVAEEVDFALDVAVKKCEVEFCEKKRLKQELQEMLRQSRFEMFDEFSAFKILKSMKDVMHMTLSNVALLETEWVAVVPSILTAFSSLYALEEDKKFLDRGGKIRFITDITYPYIELIQQHLDMEMEVRHLDKYTGLLFCVFDRKICMSAISSDIKHISLNEPLSVLYTADPTYAGYLMSTFEMLWTRATPASQRIEELLKERPSQA